MYACTYIWMYVFCGVHESASLKYPALGTIMDCNGLKCSPSFCVLESTAFFVEAIIPMDYSQLMTGQVRITKAGPFPKEAGLLCQAILVQGPLHWSP